MILLHAKDLRKYYGPEPVLDGVTVDIAAGAKIGLVGPNGTGKSTLLQILGGWMERDAGSITLSDGASVGYLAQRPDFPTGFSVWDTAILGLRKLQEQILEAEQLAAQIANADTDNRPRLAARYDRLQHMLELRDAYRWELRAESVLCGLGFPPDRWRHSVHQLSGGQQNRILLAQLLLSAPDIMLLDEPSNHLDLEATEWLESFLLESRQAFVVVSHDQFLLDRITHQTWELLHGTVDTYRGNFTAYQQQKAERLEIARRTFDRQEAEIARLEDFVRRNQYGQKHAQAEDRRKKLGRMERVPPPREIPCPAMHFPQPTRCGDLVYRVSRLTKSFATTLFSDLTFDILRGERWGILGPNGCGKTTLIRCLLQQEPATSGSVMVGQGVEPAYFDQQLMTVQDDRLLVEAVRPPRRELDEPSRRSLLARFGLMGDMAFAKVSDLSGGERNRAALAKLAAHQANVLILDEPTNHLDLWARQALEQALHEFEGTVLLISHDRHLLANVADRMLVFEPTGVRVFPGGYQAYRQMHATSLDGRSPGSIKVGASGSVSNRPTRPTTAATATKKRRFPYRKVSDLEREIAEKESSVKDLQTQLSMPEVLRDGARIKAVRESLADTERVLAVLYEHWEEAVERGDT